MSPMSSHSSDEVPDNFIVAGKDLFEVVYEPSWPPGVWALRDARGELHFPPPDAS